MSGALPPLAALSEVCLRNSAVLYVDDAHATAVMGKQGRGTVRDALDNYDNTLVVGKPRRKSAKGCPVKSPPKLKVPRLWPVTGPGVFC